MYAHKYMCAYSMEECEALCSRLTIMVAGKLRCVGSPQHLKSKYGLGYTLTIKVGDIGLVKNAYHMIANTFKGAVLKVNCHALLTGGSECVCVQEVHGAQMTFELPLIDGITYANVFAKLRALVAPLNMLDYSLNQATLEQIFIEFSKQQWRTTLDN